MTGLVVRPSAVTPSSGLSPAAVSGCLDLSTWSADGALRLLRRDRALWRNDRPEVRSTYSPLISAVSSSGELRETLCVSSLPSIPGAACWYTVASLLCRSPGLVSGVDNGGVGGRPRRYSVSYVHFMPLLMHVAHGFNPEQRAFFACIYCVSRVKY